MGPIMPQPMMPTLILLMGVPPRKVRSAGARCYRSRRRAVNGRAGNGTRESASSSPTSSTTQQWRAGSRGKSDVGTRLLLDDVLAIVVDRPARPGAIGEPVGEAPTG